MQKKLLLLLCLFVFLGIPLSVFAQSFEVSGTVTSENKEPLYGAVVQVKNGKASATTNDSGKFTITVENLGDILQISYVGLTAQEVVIKNENDLNITLNNANSLNDVVVIGYGSQKKSVSTGAISSIKAADLDNQVVARVDDALQGRTSGVSVAGISGQPGSAATVRVRGVSSINHGSNDPLYVVDGVPVDVGGIDYLNPSDIASIEVLKDAASAAIYGTRASNGVILVTTKKGNAGKMAISYNGYFGVQNTAKKLNLLNAKDYVMLRNEAAKNGGATTLPFPNESSYGEGTNWQDQIFNSARIQNHNLAFTGGNEKVMNYTSFGIFDQQGIVMKDISMYDRYNFRTNTTYKPKTWLTFGENLGYSYSKSKGIGNVNNEFGGPLSDAINLDPTTKVIETDPNVLNQPPYSNHTVMTDKNGNPYAISTQVGQEIYNPLAYEKAHLGNYNWAHNIVGNAFAEIKPVKGLSIRSTIGGKMGFWGKTEFTPIAYFNASTANAQTEYYQESNRGFSWSWENTAAYHFNANKHDFTGLIGTGAYVDNITTSNTVAYFGIPATTFEEASLNFNIPNANKLAGGSEGFAHKISSLFARAIYSYDEKYLFTGIIRRDGSTRFGENHKFGYFPSASVGWVASRENFFPVNNTLTFLKIRGSYGVVGNDNIGDFGYANIISGGRNYPTGNQYNIGYSPNSLPNPDLKWEQTAQTDLGFDAFLFNNLSVTFDVFYKKTTGMLMSIPLPSYVGTENLPLGNVAGMWTKGMELDLGYHTKVGQVTLDFKGNISYLKNQITDLGQQNYLDVSPDSKLQSSTYLLERNMVGSPVDAFYGYKIDGIFQNQAEVDNYVNSKGEKIQPNAKPGDFKWADLNHDGKISSDSDRTVLGTPLPKWTFGITLSAAWRGFDILVFGQGVAGNKIYNGLRRLDIPNANYSDAALGRWHGEGTSNDYPRLTTSDDNQNFSNPSAFMLSNGAYFRIKTLQIGYTLPKQMIDHIGFTKIRAFVSANNLLTITGYSGYDPEIGGLNYGIDKGVYPQARAYMVGLDLGF